jgi:hypothetical protein
MLQQRSINMRTSENPLLDITLDLSLWALHAIRKQGLHGTEGLT